MRNRNLIFSIVLIIVLIACGKAPITPANNSSQVTYDTIFPLKYFPAYPGSYWIYDNGDTLKVEGFEKYIFNSESFDAVPKYDTLILPKLVLNGIYNFPDTFAFVKGYAISKSKNSDYRDPAFKDILSTTQGSEFTIGAAFQGHKLTGKTIKVDTTISIDGVSYDSVIVTIQFDYACTSMGDSPENCATIKEYYAKNVGLIKREKKAYAIDTVFIKDFELIDFEIVR